MDNHAFEDVNVSITKKALQFVEFINLFTSELQPSTENEDGREKGIRNSVLQAGGRIRKKSIENVAPFSENNRTGYLIQPAALPTLHEMNSIENKPVGPYSHSQTLMYVDKIHLDFKPGCGKIISATFADTVSFSSFHVGNRIRFARNAKCNL